MKKLMYLGLFVLGLSLMSVSASSKEELRKLQLVEVTCPDGTETSYYIADDYSDEDIEDVANAACEDYQ